MKRKEFVTYEQALALKELGFDEPCLAFYDGKETKEVYYNYLRDASGDYKPFTNHERLKWFGAPLYQQAFRWFREKHNKYGLINIDLSDNLINKNFVYTIEDHLGVIVDRSEEYKTYEEAEQACIDKLLEIIK